jgi:putative transposase
MLIKKAYRYELDPNNIQRSSLAQHAGVARFAYNWGLEKRIAQYKNNQGNDRFTDAMKQHKLLNSLKKTEFSWMYETSKCAPQEALRDLHTAFKNFYRGLKNGKKIGFPRFKRRGVRDSFRLTGAIRFHERTIQLPRIGKIRIKEKKKCYYSGRILSVTVRRRANRWFVSVTVEEDILDPQAVQGAPVGIDLGVKTLATLSDGTTFANPRALGRRLRKLRQLHRSLSRKQKGSKNREKAKLRLAKMYLRVFNIRQDTLHKLTTYLAKSHGKVVIDRDLNAALNLVAVSLPETENACGEEVRLLPDSQNLQRAASMKQEPNLKYGI